MYILAPLYRALCWVLGTGHHVGQAPALSGLEGLVCCWVLPQTGGLPELGGILSGVEAPGLEQCEAC